MLDFYKTSFDNSYSAMMMLQEQMERMGAMYWGQMGNLPEEAKKGVTEWTKSYKKNCEDFKKENLQIHEFDTECLERHILLPKHADIEFVSAEYSKGILSLHIPKTEYPQKKLTSRIVVY